MPVAYYDPATAQFLTRDPLVDITREAYGYVGGNPLNNIDPTGLNWVSDASAIPATSSQVVPRPSAGVS